MTDQQPAWARGLPIDQLRAVAALYREADKPYVLGAFSLVKENTVAEWMAGDELVAYSAGKVARWQPGAGQGPVIAAAQVSVPQVRVPVRDFTGQVRTHVPAGSTVIRHPAALDDGGWGYLLELIDNADGPVWLEGWVESPGVRNLVNAARLRMVAVKIKASSELVGVWTNYDEVQYTWPERHEMVTLARLGGLPFDVQLAAAEVADLGGWADHYSSYNAKHAWSAMSLQGYVAPGDPVPAALQIVKPAEMSKAWKAEHPGWDDWPVEPTPLMRQMPRTAELVHALGMALDCTFQRVRLMRLQPGGGELTRHSDITDPEAGAGLGRLARIHVPLITNPDVRFRQWRLSGRQVEANMAAGEVWYLDTRKPHKAGNYGTTERVHLVADAYVGGTLQALIAAGEEAAEVAS